METAHKEYKVFKDLKTFFFKLCEVVLKNPESIMCSYNAGFAGSLSFCNDLYRRIKRNEIETMQTVRENRK